LNLRNECVEYCESESDSNDKKDESNEQTQKQKLEPGAFLSPTMNQNDDDKKSTTGSSSGIQQERGYSSFIVQNDKEAMEKLLNTLPLTRLPINKHETEDTSRSSNIEGDSESEGESEEVTMIDKASNGNRNENEDQQEQSPFMKMKYGPCLWIFYGRNDAERNQHLHQSQPKKQPPLCGRPEHTDSISHHGTWHYQLSGIKEWHLRPTEDLMKQMQTNNSIKKEELEFWSDYDNDSDEDDDKDNVGDSSSSHQKRNITVTCREGDVLLVNTRLWWHSTTIPEQPLEIETDANKNANTNTTRSVPSVSYARDIYLSWGDNDNHDIIQDDGNMTNLDGLYASNDIEAGMIIFTEDDAPNCELHRTKDNPNCEVIELENGSSAVVSCRDIISGEFFCLLETDDEDSNGGFESDLGEEIGEESE
jgi:hypothetical protein